MTNEGIKIPSWFWVVTGILLLWNLMGVGSFFYNISLTAETLEALTPAEQELIKNTPMWITVVFAISVLSGLLGSLLLLFKKASARAIFLLSLIAIIILQGHHLFMTAAMDVYGPSAVVLPIFIVLIGIFAIWWTKYCTKEQWLG